MKVIEEKPIVHCSRTAEANQKVVVVVVVDEAEADDAAVENHSVEAESIASSL